MQHPTAHVSWNAHLYLVYLVGDDLLSQDGNIVRFRLSKARGKGEGPGKEEGRGRRRKARGRGLVGGGGGRGRGNKDQQYQTSINGAPIRSTNKNFFLSIGF